MRFIPTAVHGVLDYVAGIVLISAPWLLGFNAGGAETWILVCLGAGMIVLSALTDYEAGLAPVIPMETHLTLDAVFGALLALSPWLFGFSGYTYLPHFIFGLLAMGAAATTKTVPRGAVREVVEATDLYPQGALAARKGRASFSSTQGSETNETRPPASERRAEERPM